VEEVCQQLDLKDVDIEYTESHYQNLVTYKMFTQHVRPILQKENSKAPSSKVMMLVAAKWREFCEENPNLKEDSEEGEAEQQEAEKSDEDEAEEEPEEAEYQPKQSRSGRSSRKAQKHVEEEEAEEEASDDDNKRSKKKSNVRASKRGKKQKVPTLKIRFGKKKNASSEEEKVSLKLSTQIH
jgi:chromodomain-helicase-DNA-binding protein 4